MNTAAETLGAARFSRGIGDVDACLQLSAAAGRQATFEHDWDTLYWSAETVGRMYMGRNEPEEAEGHYGHALDLAKMHGLSHLCGGALHDLALSVREQGDSTRFRELAGKAFVAYHESDPRNPCVVGLMADVATHAFNVDPDDKEKAAHALQSWRPVPTTMRTPLYHVSAAANAMVCAAALGWQQRYKAASEDLDRYLFKMPDNEGVAYVLSFAASGALKAGDFERAAGLCDAAVRIGTERDEDVPVQQAKALRDSALAERPISA